MNERGYAKIIADSLRPNFKSYYVETGKLLLYKQIIDATGKRKPENYQKPKKNTRDMSEGYAFETDILIYRIIQCQDEDVIVPSVVIETKLGGTSTHDIMVYSQKALMHKSVYPYLRYGLLILKGEDDGKANLDKKFFVHNIGFDFALVLDKDIKDIGKLKQKVEEQIKVSETLQKILDKDVTINEYSVTPIFK